MATHRRSVSHYNALTAIVLLLPVCIAQLSGTSTDDSDTISQSSSGFGYELLRSQLDEVQASISQLQQTAERRKECEGLENNIATILNRLETIENGLKASSEAPARSTTVNVPSNNFNEERLHNIIGNVMNTRQRNMQTLEMHHSRVHNRPAQRVTPSPSIYDIVYDSCDDVPSAGVWRIRNGIHISNVYCNKFS